MNHLFPPLASTFAHEMDGLVLFISVIVGVWFVVAEAVLLYFVVRFRRRPGRPAAYLPGRKGKAMVWILAPCAVVLGFDLLIDAASARVWDHVKVEIPLHEELVRITGRQWSWEFTYAGRDGKLDTPDDITSPNDMHVPVNTVVRYELRSADTLHSLWLPELRLKQDAVPGRSINGWFEATREGNYEVICAELCGVAHGLMKAPLTVESRESFQRWLASLAKPEGA